MSTVNTETETPYSDTDITSITFAPKEGNPNEITAQISREAPAAEKIDLGAPDQATGRLRWLDRKNMAWSLTKIGVGGLSIGGGLGDLMANGQPHLVTGGCEIIAGALVIGYSCIRMVQRTNELDAVRNLWVQKMRTEVLVSLNTISTASPKNPKP